MYTLLHTKLPTLILNLNQTETNNQYIYILTQLSFKAALLIIFIFLSIEIRCIPEWGGDKIFKLMSSMCLILAKPNIFSVRTRCLVGPPRSYRRNRGTANDADTRATANMRK